mgnify:CR=1 FL=1
MKKYKVKIGYIIEMEVNAKNKKEYSVIILAAGKSERFGSPKLSLTYDKHNSFVEHIVKEYRNLGCKEIVLLVNETGNKYLNDNNIQFLEDVKIVINKHPDWHRFYSLKLGIQALSSVQSVFVHNVDNPFVNPLVLKELLANSLKANYLAPSYNGQGGHPILISEQIVTDILSTEENQLHFKEFLNSYSKAKIPVKDEKILININTIEEYDVHF